MMAGWIGMSLVSHRFLWSSEFASRPILLLVALLCAQWLLFLWAVVNLKRTPPDERPTPVLILGLGLCFHFLLAGAHPIQEADAYRYLWDGATLSQGVSPYQFCPNDILNADPSSHQSSDMQTELALVTTPGGAETLKRVSYPEIPTIYPPAAQLVFFAGFKLTGWSWLGLRIIFIAAYFGGAALIVAALKHVHSGKLSAATLAALLLGWCPLAVKEIANSTHLDALLVLYFGAIIYIVARRAELPPIAFAVLTGIFFGLAILTKLYPMLLLPIFLAWTAGRYSWRISSIFAAVTFLVVTIGYAPFLWYDGGRVFEGFNRFSNDWLRNAGFFALLRMVFTYVFGEGQFELPLVGGAGPLGTVAAKIAAQILVIVAIAFSAVRAFKSRKSQPELESLSTLCTGVLFGWFLLLPMAFPWYLLGILPFIVCSRPHLLPWLLLFSTGCLYYLLFYTEYHNLPMAYDAVILGVEYGLPALAALIVLFVRAKQPCEKTPQVDPNFRYKKTGMRLGVVIPAFNEEDCIAEAVSAAHCAGDGKGEVRVVVCDNGSTDQTATRARSVGAEVVLESQRGYGAACLKAITHLAEWPDIILFCDADSGISATELRKIIFPILEERADFVIGTRTFAEPGSMTLPQRFGNRLATLLIRLIWGKRFRDLGPTRAIRRETLQALAMSDRTWGWTIEMQIKALQQRVRIDEIDSSWRRRKSGHSKISGTFLGVLRAGSRILWTIARLALEGSICKRRSKTGAVGGRKT